MRTLKHEDFQDVFVAFFVISSQFMRYNSFLSVLLLLLFEKLLSTLNVFFLGQDVVAVELCYCF